MRLTNDAHTSRPWRIHELARDFRLEDVWALPTPGGPGDLPRLAQRIADADPLHGDSRPTRRLWAIRRTLGELLGWDHAGAGLDGRATSLRDRLPADVRGLPPGPDFAAIRPFRHLLVYPSMMRQIDREWRRGAA